MGMEEVEMEDKRDTEVQMQMEMVLGDASWPEVTCPDCYEHHDVAPSASTSRRATPTSHTPLLCRGLTCLSSNFKSKNQQCSFILVGYP